MKLINPKIKNYEGNEKENRKNISYIHTDIVFHGATSPSYNLSDYIYVTGENPLYAFHF